MKYTLIVLLLITAMTTQAQGIRYRADKFELLRDSFRIRSPAEVDSINKIITVNLESGRIRIYTTEIQDLRIVRQAADQDSTGISRMFFTCVDLDGLQCNVELTTLIYQPHGYNATLMIIYQNMTYRYWMKLDNKMD